MGRAHIGRAHMGPGPYGLGPYGPGRYGPGPIWARAPGPGPSVLSETLTEKPTPKKRRSSCFFTYLYEAKKNRSAIPVNLTAVSRRHLLYEVQSCKTEFCHLRTWDMIFMFSL